MGSHHSLGSHQSRGSLGGHPGIDDQRYQRWLANACWFPSMGPEANSNAIAAPMVKVLNVMVVFEFIDV